MTYAEFVYPDGYRPAEWYEEYGWRVPGRRLASDLYLMATKAIHFVADISRDKPNLCHVFSEDDGNYYGQWVAGYGFAHVRFPKATTRPLTEDEVTHHAALVLDAPWGQSQIPAEQLRGGR